MCNICQKYYDGDYHQCYMRSIEPEAFVCMGVFRSKFLEETWLVLTNLSSMILNVSKTTHRRSIFLIMWFHILVVMNVKNMKCPEIKSVVVVGVTCAISIILN